MRKGIFIFLLMIVCVLGVVLIYQLVNIGVNMVNEEIEYTVSDDDIKEFLLLDVTLRNKMAKYENEPYGVYEVNEIIEKDYFEIFWGQKVGADIIRRDDNDGYIYTSVILHDANLGRYEILKNTRANMSVFSYICLDNNQEKYRYYLVGDKIEFYQDLRTGKYNRILKNNSLLPEDKQNIERICNYYINFNVN